MNHPFPTFFGVAAACLLSVLSPASAQASAPAAAPSSSPAMALSPAIKVTGAALLDSSGPEGAFIRLEQASGHAVVQFDYTARPLNIVSSRDLAVRVDNRSSSELEAYVTGLSDLKDTYKYSAQTRFFVRPSEATELRVFMPRQRLPKDHPLIRRMGDLYAFPWGHQRFWTHVDAAAIIRVTVRLDWIDARPDQTVTISAPFGHGTYDVDPSVLDTLPMPVMDEFGQSRLESWPGKVNSTDDLRADAARDLALVASVTGPGGNRSRFGGDTASPRRQATGFFRTEKIDGKWWFVDPEGHLFWSLGVNGAGNSSASTVTGREPLFPASAQGKKDFAPYRDNLMVKHGEAGWEKPHADVTLARMIDWGVNTIGAWSGPAVTTARRVPHTLIIHVGYQKIGAIHKIADPFSDEFKNILDQNLAKLAPDHADNPWLLGIFIDNELDWKGGVTVCEEALRSAPRTPARRALIDFLTARHGDLAGLNKAWGSDFADLDSVRPIAGGNETYKKDLGDFLVIFADTYFAACAAAMDKHFPHHLYLGCRFHQFNPVITAAASRHCDVISYNLYRYTVADFASVVTEDRPYIIGEFHFGARDLGVWGVGLTWAADARNQSDLVHAYLSDALRHPNIVGAHWFQWADQPVTGRSSDGENFGVGLVTIADRPAATLVAALRAVSDALYAYRLAPSAKRIGAP